MSHSTLGNGEWLLNGDSLWSPEGSVELKIQEDGKIAVYWDGECKFQSTEGEHEDIKGAKMQEDGNLWVYNDDGNAVWETDTADPTGDSTVICVV